MQALRMTEVGLFRPQDGRSRSFQTSGFKEQDLVGLEVGEIGACGSRNGRRSILQGSRWKYVGFRVVEMRVCEAQDEGVGVCGSQNGSSRRLSACRWQKQELIDLRMVGTGDCCSQDGFRSWRPSELQKLRLVGLRMAAVGACRRQNGSSRSLWDSGWQQQEIWVLVRDTEQNGGLVFDN